MTDMVFLLLTFFIIGVSFSGENTKLDVNLPKSKSITKTIPQKNEPFTIEIDDNDNLALNGKVVTMEELDLKLAEQSQKDPEQIITIKGDKAVPYGRVVKVLGLCLHYNLTKISVAALLQQPGEPDE